MVPFDSVSTQELGSIVSETFNKEKTYMQFSHELLLQRINAMLKKIFIFMLLFLASRSLTTFSLTKKARDNVSVSFTHITAWLKNMTLYINVGHCFSDVNGQIIVGHCFSDIYGHMIHYLKFDLLRITLTMSCQHFPPKYIYKFLVNQFWKLTQRCSLKVS